MSNSAFFFFIKIHPNNLQTIKNKIKYFLHKNNNNFSNLKKKKTKQTNGAYILLKSTILFKHLS